MDCNFACPYCFETKEKGIMDEQLIKHLVKWIGELLKIFP